jgi:hypothetical protein
VVSPSQDERLQQALEQVLERLLISPRVLKEIRDAWTGLQDGPSHDPVVRDQRRRLSLRDARDEAVRATLDELPAPAHFDVHQAGVYLSVTRKQLEHWRTRGLGPPFAKVGRLVRYARCDLDAWMAARRVANTAQEVRP